MPSCFGTIGQAELREYRRLVASDKRRQELRASLLARLEAGAVVEPGRLTAYFEAHESPRLTWAGLEEVLGEARVKKVRERLEPVTTSYLRVVEDKGGHVTWEGD